MKKLLLIGGVVALAAIIFNAVFGKSYQEQRPLPQLGSLNRLADSLEPIHPRW